MQHRPVIVIVALLSAVPRPGGGAEAGADPRLEYLTAGVLVHDRGPTSDRHESGVDPNLELQFRPPARAFWQSIGAPRPHIGLTPNLRGDTSAFYGGITYAFEPTPRLFTEIALGIALHDGPLHADDRRACEQDSDCGFGSRVILRYGLELGMRLDRNRAVTLFYDHMSHQEMLADENEGIDHVGLRYRIRY